jgi:Protein of unknown function (DUF3579)
MVTANEYFIIFGKDATGRKLRPSDWIERICSTFARYDEDRRLRYSSALIPGLIDGEKCLLVSPDLATINPAACAHVMEFIRSNHLQMHAPAGIPQPTMARCA